MAKANVYIYIYMYFFQSQTDVEEGTYFATTIGRKTFC